MPPNIEAGKARNRHVWRTAREIHVSFDDFTRAFKALEKLSTAGQECEYDGHGAGKYWIRIRKAP